MNSTKIAFIGLGRMGSGMAARLQDAGYRVAVYNRTAERAQPLTSRGAELAASPKQAAKGATAVLAMVADDEASKTVWLGPDGALAGMQAGAFVIECSTVSHDWVEELAGEAATRQLRYIDCP
ncbi:MAG: NAD(P)-dependent oxidoreductase, partial [Aestuariivirgaceae bacterium]